MAERDLSKARCVPCHGGVEPLAAEEARRLLERAPGWSISEDGKQLHRRFEFKDFEQAMRFVNRVAVVAEEQQHHPDIDIRWNVVKLVLWTHAIHGLHENDFILAAHVNAVARGGQ